MATENTLMAMAPPSHSHIHEVERVEPISAPEPLEKNEVEEVSEEEYYKSVLEQAPTKTADAPVEHEQIQGVKMEANYEAMTLKELKEEAKRRGVKLGTNPHKKDIIDALKRTGQNQTSVLEPVPGSFGEINLEDGFPVELAK
jgi:hypothetical protein